VPSLAQSERLRLCDTALVVGPDAPTLSGEWNVRDLLAHLVVRDSDPVSGPGIVLPPLAFLTERRMRSIARADFAHLVERVRRPAVWAPARLPQLDKALNTLEFFVHHEDIRRAQPGWAPRELTMGEQKQLWKAIGYAGRGLVRRSGVPAAIRWEETGVETTLRRGERPVMVTGDPGEITLFLFGRDRVSGLAFDGPPPHVTKLRHAGLGI
jgi:uncharacterized protein (TIGR03085 family)